MDFKKNKISLCTIIISVLIVVCFFATAIFLSFGIGINVGVANATTDFQSVGKASYLVDTSTGTVIYSRNEKERLPIASMVKIMTALLTLEAVDRGDITLDDDVQVSETAASMGGSQVFLDANTTHKAGELLKTVIVASANDSCVALAEHISGSVSSFVDRMNARAKELGMQNTAFKNCTGLPAAESFSSAEDVAIMFSKLIEHETYFEYAHIWLEDYKHPDGRTTTITNTNKLVRFYNGCDGGKTGFTSEAKFCLSATAKRDDMRVIAVIIGADSSKTRNAGVSAMFDHAFANYSNKILLKAGENLDMMLNVSGGRKDKIAITVQNDVSQFMSKQDSGAYELKYELPSYVKAPVKQGDVVGAVYLTKDGVIVSKTNIIANESVDRMTLFDAIIEIGKHWSTIVK